MTAFEARPGPCFALVLSASSLIAPAMAQTPSESQSYLVVVYVDGNDTGELADIEVASNGAIFIPSDQLEEIGIEVDTIGQVNLTDMKTLAANFDLLNLRLDIFRLGQFADQNQYRATPSPKLSQQIPALIVDYGLNVQHLSEPDQEYQSIYGNLDLAYTDDLWTFQNRLYGFTSPDETSLVRIETSVEKELPDQMTRLRLGDGFYRATPWGRSSAFAGVQYGTDFTLRPTQSFRPYIVLERLLLERSEVEVVVNGVSQGSRTSNPGVELISPQQQDGLNSVAIRIRDALGVETVEELSFYSSSSALAIGAEDYSFSLGVPRRFEDLTSQYDNELIATALYRRGMSNWMTFETHSEVSGTTANVGVGGVFTLKDYGSANFAIAQSATDSGAGGLVRFGFQHRRKGLSLTTQVQLANKEYADLSSRKGVAFPDQQMRIGLSHGTSFGRYSVGYNTIDDEELPDRRFMNATWEYDVGDGLNVFANGFSDFVDSSYGLNIGLRWTFGAGFARVTAENNDGSHRQSVDYGQGRTKRYGWQWSASSLRSENDWLFRGDANHLSDHGEVFLSATTQSNIHNLIAGVRGSVVTTGSYTKLTHNHGAAHALVDVGMLKSAQVYQDNTAIGPANEDGLILISTLRPYQENTIALRPEEIPLDYVVQDTELTIIPPSRGVVRASFDVEKDSSLSFTVTPSKGTAIPVGAVITLQESGARTVVGHGGRVFFQKADDTDTVTLTLDGRTYSQSVKALKQSLQMALTASGEPE